MEDTEKEIAAKVARAAADKAPLAIRGGGARAFYGEPLIGDVLEVGALSGIIRYEPDELFITAGGATPLSEIHQTLANAGQTLAFEPPSYHPAATLGGTIACGFSGPRRATAGALRDFMLGVRVIDGSGDILNFGGSVMKNVAGFDVARLMAGAQGALGIIARATLKTAPCPPAEITLRFAKTATVDAAYQTNRALARGAPISASAFVGDEMWWRLEGGESAIAKAASILGGDATGGAESARFWENVREHRHPFFQTGEGDLWRISAPPAADAPFAADFFTEWHGATRWVFLPPDAKDKAREGAAKIGGAATLFRPQNAAAIHRFPPLPPAAFKLHQNLKRVFDPRGVLNPGRPYQLG
jgi:glycolate oxidase FAD binding subunit